MSNQPTPQNELRMVPVFFGTTAHHIIVRCEINGYPAARISALSFSVLITYGNMVKGRFDGDHHEIFLFSEYPEFACWHADGVWDTECISDFMTQSGLQVEPEQAVH